MSATVAAEPENPLVAGLERQPVAPTTLVIFGATGDLARAQTASRAVQPRRTTGALPERFYLVGVSRKEKTHEHYRSECEQAIRSFSRRPPDEDVLKRLLQDVRYVPGTFDDGEMYARAGRGARRASTSTPANR